MQKLYAVAANTFIETVRQPIYGILLWVAVGLLVLSPMTAAFSLESGGDNKVMQDVSLATLLLYGLMCAVFSASGVITREIQDFTVLTVISKPISRPLFLSGKYLGVLAAVGVGYYFLSLVMFLAVRHGVMETAATEYDRPVLIGSAIALFIALTAATFCNYVYGWHFSSTLTAFIVPLTTAVLLVVLFVARDGKLQPPTKDFGDLKLLYALCMTYCGIVILTAFAAALSTRFSQVVTLTLCAGVYLLGLMSDYYLGRPAEAGGAWFFNVAYAAAPNFQFFWAGSAITQELTIPGAQVAQVAGYAAMYSLAILSVGVALFETREVG